MTGRLAGKSAIVTGAGSGIGRAAALRFAAEGAAVLCADIAADRNEETAGLARDSGGTAVAQHADVSDADSVRAMAGRAVAEFGSIDVLYANAGVIGVGSAHDCDEAEWYRILDINLTGVFLCGKYVLPHMLEAGSGAIVNQASIGGMRGVGRLAAYCASKAGVIGLTKQMAVDYGPYGIRVNAIAPGTIPTPLIRGLWAQGAGLVQGSTEEELAASAGQVYPMRRTGTEEEVAGVALFLASDESGWMTGSVVTIDGGKTAT
jgi:NAD(P)-dependent dehydrogenase (short-subunit alcohol dehydrogenase family)